MAKKTTPKKAAAKLDQIAEQLRPLAVPIDEPVLDPQNARTHDQAGVDAIAASLSQFGQPKPIVADRETRKVLAGNGTLLAAKQLGWTHLAVVYVEYDEQAQRGFAIADNRTAELAGWDAELLMQQIDLIETDTPDLAAAWQLAELKQSLDQGEPNADQTAEPDDDPPAGDQQVVPEHYQVVVDCADEDAQRAMYERLQAEGHQCRLLTL